MTKYVLIPILSLLASPLTHAKTIKKAGIRPNEARLRCYRDLREHHISTATKSTYAEVGQMPRNGKDFAHKLFRGADQYLVIPSPRDGQNGFYLISDLSSTWVSLPPAKPWPKDPSGVVKPSDCLHFKSPESLGGEIYVTYMNYGDDVTNPAEILKEKPRDMTCKDQKFSTVVDPEQTQVFTKDLMARIDQVGFGVMNQRMQTDKSNMSAVSSLTLKTKEVAKALDRCGELLDAKKDAELLKRLDGARLLAGLLKPGELDRKYPENDK